MTAPHPKVQNNGIVTVFFESPDRDIVLAHCLEWSQEVTDLT